MPLTVASFKQVATSFKTHKELHPTDHEDPADHLLTEQETEDLKQEYPCVDDALFQQILVVRKGHREHATQMLHDLVEFRKANGWGTRIGEEDLHPGVRDSGAHSLGGFTDCQRKRPIIYYKLHKIDVGVASAKDFQQQGQYMIQEASKLHPLGEVAVTLDFAHASFAILGKLSSQDMTRGMDLFGKFPVKVKRLYIKNDSRLVRVVIKAVLAFAGTRTRSKVTFLSHDNND